MAWLHENSTLSSKLRSATNYAATTLTKTYEGSLTTLIPPSLFLRRKYVKIASQKTPTTFWSLLISHLLTSVVVGTIYLQHNISLSFLRKSVHDCFNFAGKKLRVVIPFFKETCNYCQNKLQVKGGHHEKIAHFSGLYRITTTPL